MNASEARRVLLRDTLEDDGTFLRLRLGEDPGEDSIRNLRQALRVVWQTTKQEDGLPREIALACAMILRFSEECTANHRSRTQRSAAGGDAVELWIQDLAQGAFDVLAGAHAEGWVVRRPDLGER